MQSSLSSLYQIFGDLTNIGSIVMGVLGLLFCSLLLAGLCKGDDARVAARPRQLSAPRRAGVAAGAGAGLHPHQHRGGGQPHHLGHRGHHPGLGCPVT